MVEESLHGTDISTNIPECPVSRFLSLTITDSCSVQVCLETYTRNSPIFSCVNGHFTCGTCKAQMSRKADMQAMFYNIFPYFFFKKALSPC